MNLSFTIFRRRGVREHWTLVGAHGHALSRSGRNPTRLQHSLRDDLRKLVKELPVSALRSLERAQSTRLLHVRLELQFNDERGRRKFSGRWPLIVEERSAGPERVLRIAYHPERKQHWFCVEQSDELELQVQAQRFFREALSDHDDRELQALFSNGREQLLAISVSATPKPPALGGARRAKLTQAQPRPPVLSTLGLDRSELVESRGVGQLGVAREPYRTQLGALLTGRIKRSVLVIGESGSGRSALIDQVVHDLLVADEFPIHRNFDRVHRVIQIAGRQLIAGMSFAGEWEQRCFDLFAEAAQQRVILWITDLPVFGRTGQSQQSSRSLAEVFAGPIARGELVVVAELSEGELEQLEDRVPGFTAPFARVTLPAASHDETFAMLLQRLRQYEARDTMYLSPDALFALLELASSLSTRRALPGAALDWLERLERTYPDMYQRSLGGTTVRAFVAYETGLRRELIDPAGELAFEPLCAQLEERVLGQAPAVARVAEIVLRLKAGLHDPRRPYGVFLFTGPTGTGKTELAKALSGALYLGEAEHLLRFDMGEYGDLDACARLIGDGGEGGGSLTRALHEQPFCVVLFDEIEKAHASVFPLLLQVLDEGRLSDADGRSVSFRNAVVVMTSNLGARARGSAGFDPGALPAASDSQRAVTDFFAPEFVNRIDHLVAFAPLQLSHARLIVRRELAKLCARPGLRDRNAVVLADDAAIALIASEAFAAQDGARSLRRYLEDHVASLLADAIARAPDSALRLVQLRAADTGLRVDEHRLLEAPPLQARFALEALLERPLRELLQCVPEAIAQLDALGASPALGELAERIREGLSAHLRQRRVADAELYSLEWLRSELARLREHLGQHVLAADELDSLLQEAQADFVVHREFSGSLSAEAVRARGLPAPALRREALIAALARVAFLRRALGGVHLASQHLVEIALLAVPSRARTDEGLLQWLAAALARAHGELDEFAVAAGEELTRGRSLDALDAALRSQVTGVVLRMAGPCVHDFFAPEDGMHVLQPSTRDAELVRVMIAAGARDIRPGERLLALQAALAQGDGGGLLDTQLTRLIRFEPPPVRASALLELEDYPHAHVKRVQVRSVAAALEPLWLLRLSREDYAT